MGALGKVILGPFLALKGPRTLHFGGLSLYFENFLARKTVGSRETLREGLFFTFLKIGISEFFASK